MIEQEEEIDTYCFSVLDAKRKTSGVILTLVLIIVPISLFMLCVR